MDRLSKQEKERKKGRQTETKKYILPGASDGTDFLGRDLLQ